MILGGSWEKSVEFLLTSEVPENKLVMELWAEMRSEASLHANEWEEVQGLTALEPWVFGRCLLLLAAEIGWKEVMDLWGPARVNLISYVICV